MASVLGGGTFTREREQRVFAYAMLASIVLHGALLFANFQFRDPAKKPNPVPGPIVARLVAPPPAATPAPTEAAPGPRAEEPPPPRPVAKPKSVPVPVPAAKAAPKAPVVAAKPAPTATPSEDAKPAAEIPPPAAPSAPVSAPPSPGTIAKADAQRASPAPDESADAGTVAKYRFALHQEAARPRYKTYPRVARDNNWEGKVVIWMVIGTNTMVSSMSIKSSSGHEVLDQTAMDLIRKAKPMVQIPAALRGKEFGVDINFVFRLEDKDF